MCGLSWLFCSQYMSHNVTECIVMWTLPGAVWVVTMATSVKLLACYLCSFQLEEKTKSQKGEKQVEMCVVLAVQIILFSSWICACLG